MGVVYKAEDTKLDRPVALKFLPSHLLGDEEIKKRFEREAKAAAALHHPNICPVYEIDEADGKSFISMAFIDGESLDSKIAVGPLKLEDALDIAKQIAGGLEAAHEKGIYHRDIKPENMIVDSKGRVTIMDFGLAQLTEASRLTKTDQTMGTVFYMSPEQTEGSGTDHRTDIWSLGVVLYEMITGRRPFKGDYDKAVMYSILNEEPEPITGLRTGVPIKLEDHIGKALAKKADDRYQSASELIVDLRTLSDKLSSGSSRDVVSPAETRHDVGVLPGVRPPRTFTAALLALTGLLLTVNLYQWLASSDTDTHTAPVRRFALDGINSRLLDERALFISPDGTKIAYLSDESIPRIWIRSMDQERPRPIQGSEGLNYGPAWSPDGRFIAFGVRDELKRVSIEDNSIVTLCSGPALVRTPAWSANGELIVFAAQRTTFPVLYQVSSLGGEAELLFEPIPTDKGIGHKSPLFIPGLDGRQVLLFTVGSPSDKDVYVVDLDRGERRFLVEGARPAYSPSGHIVFQAGPYDPRLFALPFSTDTLEATGKPFPIGEGGYDPTVAGDGTLVFTDFPHRPNNRLVWADRRGRRIGPIGVLQQSIAHPSLSPDGRWVAVEASDGGDDDIWIHSTDRGINRRLIDTPGRDGLPVWRTASELTYFSTSQGAGDILRISASGSSESTPLITSPLQERNHDWSRDGKHVVFLRSSERTGTDLWVGVERLEGELEERPLLVSSANEGNPQFSPDGKHLAYTSDETGRIELWLREYPEGRALQVSESGGGPPRWGPGGRDLYYLVGPEMHVAELSLAPDFRVLRDEVLFTLSAPFRTRAGDGTIFDVADDGRFVFTEEVPDETAPPPQIHVVQNWYKEFRER